MTMPKEFYKTGNYEVNHTTFGGLIYASDFCTNHSGSSDTKGSVIADRIISDWKFDESCKKKTNNITNWRKPN